MVIDSLDWTGPLTALKGYDSDSNNAMVLTISLK